MSCISPKPQIYFSEIRVKSDRKCRTLRTSNFKHILLLEIVFYLFGFSDQVIRIKICCISVKIKSWPVRKTFALGPCLSFACLWIGRTHHFVSKSNRICLSDLSVENKTTSLIKAAAQGSSRITSARIWSRQYTPPARRCCHRGTKTNERTRITRTHANRK